MASRIPSDLTEFILAKAGAGLSTREISKALLDEKGLKVSHAAVGRRLREIRDERKPIAQAVIAEKLGKTVTTDLDELDAVRSRLKTYEVTAAEKKELDVAIRAARAQAHVIATKLHFAGAGDGEPPDVDARTRLLKKLEQLAS